MWVSEASVARERSALGSGRASSTVATMTAFMVANVVDMVGKTSATSHGVIE